MSENRWDQFTREENNMIHHALRVLLTHPLKMKDDEQELCTRLADESWDRHCQRVEAEHSRLV